LAKALLLTSLSFRVPWIYTCILFITCFCYS
jgi:hypothetical protein